MTGQNTKKTGVNDFTQQLKLRWVKLLNVILVTAPYLLVWFFYYSTRIREQFYQRGHYVVIAVFVVLYILLSRIYEGFLIDIRRMSEIVSGQALSVGITDVLLYVITILLAKKMPNPLPMVLCLAVQLLLIVLWTMWSHRWYNRHISPKESAIIWDMRHDVEGLVQNHRLQHRYRIVKTVQAQECLKDLEGTLKNIQVVFLAGVHSVDRNVIAKHRIQNAITMLTIPRVGDVIMSGAEPMQMLHLPILRVTRYNPTPEYLVLKRLLDIILSSVALVLASPVMLVVAILIKAHDRGTVFYRQTRITKDRREFEILKFRSMRMDAEGDGVARLSSGENDSRITSIGKFIRKTRIDELPQLINIIKGEMSIVGPRPERPEIAEQYEEQLPEFALRFQAKAGLTGYAQVYGKYNTEPYDKLLMDLMYISKPSLAKDLQLMLATVKVLFTKESTEGIEEGQTTAATKEQLVDPQDGKCE